MCGPSGNPSAGEPLRTRSCSGNARATALTSDGGGRRRRASSGRGGGRDPHSRLRGCAGAGSIGGRCGDGEVLLTACRPSSAARMVAAGRGGPFVEGRGGVRPGPTCRVPFPPGRRRDSARSAAAVAVPAVGDQKLRMPGIGYDHIDVGRTRRARSCLQYSCILQARSCLQYRKSSWYTAGSVVLAVQFVLLYDRVSSDTAGSVVLYPVRGWSDNYVAVSSDG